MKPKNSVIRKIQTEAKKEGDFLLGFARLDEESLIFDPEITKSPEKLYSAVSLAVPLNLEILRTITDRPTIIYKHHYQQINYLLDRVSLRIARLIEREGSRALPIPASVYTQRAGQKAHLCHRSIAHRAGIGWWGKCNLIVHSTFGAGIRLATVLTDLPFDSATLKDRTKPDGCGECRACSEACPAHAIGKDISEFNRSACFAQVKEFERKVIGVGICGICARACREAIANRSAATSNE